MELRERRTVSTPLKNRSPMVLRERGISTLLKVIPDEIYPRDLRECSMISIVLDRQRHLVRESIKQAPDCKISEIVGAAWKTDLRDGLDKLDVLADSNHSVYPNPKSMLLSGGAENDVNFTDKSENDHEAVCKYTETSYRPCYVMLERLEMLPYSNNHSANHTLGLNDMCHQKGKSSSVLATNAVNKNLNDFKRSASASEVVSCGVPNQSVPHGYQCQNRDSVCMIMGELVTGVAEVRELSCPHCNRKFLNKQALIRHVIIFHDRKRCFECSACDKGFKHNHSLKRHIRKVHMAVRNYVCSTCDEGFLKRSELKIHILCGHIRCGICEKVFKQKSALKRHVLFVHENQRNMVCLMCEKRFQTTSTLRVHILTVHYEQKNFVCRICNKWFLHKCALKRHILNIHQGQRKFMCPKCNKRFHMKSSMMTHILGVHKKQRNFICAVCEKGYLNKFELKRHIWTVHEQKRNFACTTCEKVFQQKSSLKVHILNVHEKQRDYVCAVCQKSFQRKFRLRIHIFTYHLHRYT